MDLRPGYKHSEIGPIPEDWDAVPLGDLFTFKNGLNKAKRYFGYGTPIVNYMDVFRQPGLRLDRIEGRVDVSKSELEAFEVRKGDVFFTRTSETVEEIGVAAAMLDPANDVVFSGFVLRARPTDDRLDDLYKAYCFSPRYFRQQIVARATYTTRALTNGRSLSASILAVPPAAEQQAIAESLSDVDASITYTARLIAKKRDLRTAAVQRLLSGKVRLASFSEAWKDVELGDVASFVKGKGLSKAVLSVHGSEPCIHYGELFTKYPEEISEVISRTHSPYNPVRSLTNDVLMPTSDVTPRGLAKASCLLMDGVVLGGDILVIRPDKDKVHGTFLSHVIRRDDDQVLQLVTGTTVFHLYGSDMKKFRFALPSFEEQCAIVGVLADMDAEITKLESRLEKSRALKTGMMQALLTGRVRLPVQSEVWDVLEVAHA